MWPGAKMQKNLAGRDLKSSEHPQEGDYTIEYLPDAWLTHVYAVETTSFIYRTCRRYKQWETD